MNLEKDVCRKVYDHHDVLKARLSQVLIEAGAKHSLTKETLMNLVKQLSSEVDSSSDKLVTDYQKTIKEHLK